MKQFTKSLKHNKRSFQYFKMILPEINNTDLILTSFIFGKTILVGLQIFQLNADEDFEETMNKAELEA